MCVCVCERKREREREKEAFQMSCARALVQLWDLLSTESVLLGINMACGEVPSVCVAW